MSRPSAGGHHHWATDSSSRFDKLRRIRQALYAAPAHDGLVACGFGGIPWASVLAFERELPLWLVRKEVDSSRAGYMGVVGPDLAKGKKPRVIIVEDVVSSGTTLRWILSQLGADFTVAGIVTLGSAYGSEVRAYPHVACVAYEMESDGWLPAAGA